MEGGAASAQRAGAPYHTGRCRAGNSHSRDGESLGDADRCHTRRKYAVAGSAAALIVAVCCVAAVFNAPPQASIVTLEQTTTSAAKGPKALEAQIAKLMQEVRHDSLDEQRSVQRRERVELHLEEHEEWMQQHNSKQKAMSAESLANVLGGEHVHESMDELKEKLARASKKAREDKEQRAAVQKVLDAKLNALSAEQIAAHNAQVKIQRKQAALAARKEARTSDLASSPSAKQQRQAGEELLASIGEEMLHIPAVANALTQALGSRDLDLAREIAKSLGRNVTEVEPIDPAIVAEAEIAAAEQEGGEPLKEDKETKALNVTGLLDPIPDDLVAEAAQAQKEIDIQKKLQG